ncbi:hypothetical protein [Flavobacterium sp. JP2137]|uniref:hypothetical protein n=1 Tax=Flavobacterium sp. JP2137 TaxID=3414510 RepID=UPI003D2FADD7
MKKLFMFLAVAGLATFGTACSSSDDSNPVIPPPPPAEGQLALTANKTTVEIDEKVTFTVKLAGAAVADAELFIDGTKISGYETSFPTAKTYKVVAKKAGSKDSSELTITVKDKPAAIKTITLTSDAGATPAYGQAVTFTVKGDTGADVTSNAAFKVNGVAITGNTYTLKAGNTSVVATYVVDGTTLTSNTLTFNGITEPTFTSFFTYDGAKYETTHSQYIYNDTFEQGTDVYDVWILFVYSLDANDEVKDGFSFQTALKRTNPEVKVFLPNTGPLTTGFPGSSVVFINGVNVAGAANPGKTFSAMALKNFNPVQDGENLVSGPTTNFVYSLQLTDLKTVIGTHTGEVVVFNEVPSQERTSNSNGSMAKFKSLSIGKKGQLRTSN